MIKKEIKIRTFVLIACLGLFFLPIIALAAGWPLEIQIPGPKGIKYGGSGVELVAYINAIYAFVALIVGVMGAVMFIIGGFQYLISAGNTSAAGEAKKTMFAAVAGIVIVLTAYLLLKIINKELVDLQNPSATWFLDLPSSWLQ